MKRFINFSLAITALMAVLLVWSCKPSATKETASDTPLVNALTPEEEAAGWELLFDGSTLDGWKRFNRDTIGPLWRVEDSCIIVQGEGLGEGSGVWGGSLITLKQYGNFELVCDFKVSPGGNSGILYHVVEGAQYTHDYVTGPEYQVMDDEGWTGDSLHAAQTVGSNYDMFAAPATKITKPVGEWNTAKIIYNNGHVEHWLNGEKTVEFEEGSPAYNEAFENSKWNGTEYPDWNKFKTGSLSLQDHGAPIWFRNIKVREL
jgi:hypothetical protein